MAKYLLLKHYRGAPAPEQDIPMDQWTPEEVEAHIRFMSDFATRLDGGGAASHRATCGERDQRERTMPETRSTVSP